MNHRIEYRIHGAGTGTTFYSASCTCGEYLESWNAMTLTQWGPAHVSAMLDEVLS